MASDDYNKKINISTSIQRTSLNLSQTISAGLSSWGSIAGNINDQTDLIALFNTKQDIITDLDVIRLNALAGKNASDTIATYGDIVTHNVDEFATSAQGTKADTAIQPNDNISRLTNDAGYITKSVDDLENYTKTSGLAPVALSNDFNDLDNQPVIGDGVLTISVNNQELGQFSANSTNNKLINIDVPDSATWGNITGNILNQNDLQSQFNTKQDNLISGENIKTINNESILGSGNIEIRGGGIGNLDGGTATSIYTIDQVIDGGSAEFVA